MIIDQSGSMANVKRHDYLPFGEELFAPAGGRSVTLGYASGDGIRQQFTAKERDVETRLDYFLARYYSSLQGRFTSPDEFSGGPEELYEDVDPHDPLFYADIVEPQSLNKYHYALNNPLKYVDEDGHQTSLADRLKSGAVSVGRTLLNTVEGAASAYGEDNGVGGTTGPQNAVGRGIGHTLALGQATFEIASGVGAMLSGGGEAVVTAGACGTGVGCVAPAVGVVQAARGLVVAAHGAVVGVNTAINIFRHGNAASSTRPQHGYEIVDQKGDVKKVGVSGQKLNQNGSSPRANSQVNRANRSRPANNQVEGRVRRTNVPSRRQILEWERQQAELRRSQGHSMDMHTRP